MKSERNCSRASSAVFLQAMLDKKVDTQSIFLTPEKSSFYKNT